MKLSVFLNKAPTLISAFSANLDKVVNDDTVGLNLNEMRATAVAAKTANDAVGAMLTSVNKAQLLQLRANADAGSAYGTAVDHNASLNSILSTLINMLPEEEKQDSIDDIMSAPVSSEESVAEPVEEPVVTEPVTEEADPAVDLDSVMDEENCGMKPTNTDGNPAGDVEGEGETDATTNDAEVATNGDEEEDDFEISPENFNFAGVTPTIVKKPAQNSNTNSSSIVSKNFLA